MDRITVGTVMLRKHLNVSSCGCSNGKELNQHSNIVNITHLLHVNGKVLYKVMFENRADLKRFLTTLYWTCFFTVI